MKFELLTEPTKADRDAVLNPLLRFNEKIVGSNRKKEITMHVKNEQGEIVAGGNGYVHFNYFFIEHLFVSDTLRGQGVGAKLLEKMEAEARARQCDHVWLDTFSFQAPGFYEKQGYKRFGNLANYPPGHQRHFYFKEFITK
jgi:ribosomal protein S18 acetylase RimI-like enzyme